MKLASIFAAGAFSALACAPSFAGLGDHAVSVTTDARALRAKSLSARPGTSASWTRNELTLQDGLATEFSDASGTVFAVSWKTQSMPDLSSLLGGHKGAFDSAQTQQGEKMRSPRRFAATAGDMTVLSTGHLRAFQGYAYLSSMLPQGFDLGELSK